MSDEITIDGYDKTKTRVHIAGVHLGLSPEFSCDKPLDLDGVVTSNQTATRFTSDTQQSCTSPRGTMLLVSGVDGYDLDQRAPALGVGDWTLNFELDLQTPEPTDGGIGLDDYTVVTCKFELTLS